MIWAPGLLAREIIDMVQTLTVMTKYVRDKEMMIAEELSPRNEIVQLRNITGAVKLLEMSHK